MLVSWNWLKDYIDINVGVEEFCDRLIMSGSNLETCTPVGAGIKGVKLGRIDKIEKHPNADKLVICQINLGNETVQIVTGAPNVFEGAFVPVCVDGSIIPGPLHGQPKQEGGVKITKGQLRGVDSFGMLCSAGELGFDEKVAPLISKDGIWILEGDWSHKLGAELTEALELEDYTIDFEITPNRPDCLSMLGMARETSATLGGEVKYPETACKETVDDVNDYLQVEVKSDLCTRYTARVIKDVKIAQSPWWFQKKLMSAGMRPINNIVDITNFVMMEYGQPLHAFDIRNIEGGKIIVDTADAGEKFTTLDGKERTLTEDMLMIKDSKKSIALAGVMGGLNSEVLDDTNVIVLESANFIGSSVRKTSKTIGLRTEASGRYEKGIDPNLCHDAADRFCNLVELLEAGTIVGGAIDIYKSVYEAKKVDVRVSRINKVLGTDISREDMEKILKSLECQVSGEGDVMSVTPPTVRQDLLAEVDFVEEIARIYGYDNLPMTLPAGRHITAQSKSRRLRGVAADALCAMGANEIQTFSFVSPSQIDKINLDEDSIERAFVKLINPLGEDTSVMRTVLTPSMLEVLSRNFNRNVENVRAFEIGTTFMDNFIDPNALPFEDFSLSIGVYGENENFFTLKGMISALLPKLGIKKFEFVAEKEYGLYHPGRCAKIVTDADNGEQVELGIMGEVHPDVAENYQLDTRVYCAELMLDPIEELSDREIHYHQPPKYPSTSRDIALLVDEAVAAGDLKKAMLGQGHEILRTVKLFDIYRGEQVDTGKKSMAFNLTYRHDDKTLTDSEVEVVHNDILKVLKDKFNATLRD